MTVAVVLCSLCKGEKYTKGTMVDGELVGFDICRYCDELLCMYCDEPAPAKYLDGVRCGKCGKRHPKSG